MIISGRIDNDNVVQARIAKVSVNVLVRVKGAVEEWTYKLMRKVMEEKLSGQVLNKRTGNLRRSIPRGTHVTETGSSVVGVVGLGDDQKIAKYGAIHEYGGTIPAHTVEIKNKLALRWMNNGTPRFAKRVNIPAVTMPERSFLRSSLKESELDFKLAVEKAIQQGAKDK
jgi:phage gpG-like protein